MTIQDPYEMEKAVKRRQSFSSWASLAMLLGFFAVLYLAMELHGVHAAILGMIYGASCGAAVLHERRLKQKIDDIWRRHEQRQAGEAN